MLLHAMSVSERFSVKQKAAFSRAILNYLEQIGERRVTNRVNPKSLSQRDFPAIAKPTFFKFLTPESASFLRRGSFRFGTTSYYRSIQDCERADILEGYAAIFLEGKHKSFNFCGTAGFNCVVLCGVATPPHDHRNLRHMRNKFGHELIEITNIDGFMSILSERLGSHAHYVRDVRYMDGKYISIKTDDLEEYLPTFGRGNLSEEIVHNLNVRYWHNFYEGIFWPAAFSKPSRFSHERERRLLFEFLSDIDAPFISVDAPEALEFIRFVPMPSLGRR